ncbi:MAG: peptidylprolyl isomerase [Gemmatimonadaceae bacterium]|nr:peptidylprolyl isomerase [Gemmatimonadaceae bacterium]
MRGNTLSYGTRYLGRIQGIALLVGGAMLVGGCARLRPTADGELLGDDAVVAHARLLQMADTRAMDTLLVRQALAASTPSVRAAAALAIGQVSGRTLNHLARSLLADGDSAVAANAAYSLGLLRDTASVPALTGALGGRQSVAVEAAWALGQIGAPSRAAIEDALSKAALPEPVLASLLLATAKLRPVPVAQLIPFLRHSNAEIRWSAAYPVSRTLAPAGVRAMLDAARDESAPVRALAARALGRSATGDSLAAEALGALDTLARDSSAHVRINAVRSLASYGSAATTAVVALTADRDANVRIATAQILGTVLPPQRSVWISAWNADTAFMYRRSLLVSAVRAGAMLPALSPASADGWASHADWRYRAAAAEAGGSARSSSALLENALPHVGDADGRVRLAAYTAFATYADSSRFAWRNQILVPALNDPDFYVRATVLQALGSRASAAETPGILASYQRALADSLNDARIAAVRYLAAAWKRDSTNFPDSVRAMVQALKPSDDPLVRAEALESSIFSSWIAAPPGRRRLDWYQRKVRSVLLPALAGRPLSATIQTERGAMTVELFSIDAPLTVDNFASLARAGYYRNVQFHRVVPNFVAQDGDPRGDGNGGPGYAIRDELNRRRYGRGAVGMALSGPDTGGSQYFITHSPQPHLDGGYTVFGRILDGFEVLDALVQGDRILQVRIR